MAMIQKIRDNSALTFIVVGGALLAFVLTDSLNSSSGGDGFDNVVGSFEGKDISIDEFNGHRKTLSILQNPTKDFASYNDQEKGQSNQSSWQMILNEKFINEEAKSLGLTVSPEEVDVMIAGDEETGEGVSGFYVNYLFGGQQNYFKNREAIANDIDRYFDFASIAYRNPQTQQTSALKINEGTAEAIKNFGVRLRVQDKYNKLVQNCFFTTSSLAKDEYQKNQAKKDFQVAVARYDLVNDSATITPSQAEIEAAYSELKETFKNKEKENRKLVFASFPVHPSQKDIQAVIKEVAAIKLELLDTTYQNDKNSKFNTFKYESDLGNYAKYFKKGEYPIKLNGIDTTIFNSKKGEAVGPFSDGTNAQFGVAQVLDEKMLADSAKVTSINLSPQPWYKEIMGTNENMTQELNEKFQKAYADGCDSILDLIKNNKDAIKSIPQEYWLDSTAFAKGGDRGWIQDNGRQFGQNFNDSVFFSNEGDVKKAFIPAGRNQGYYAVLIVNELGAKVRKLQIGTVIKKVSPLDETLQGYMKKAQTLAYALNQGEAIGVLRDSLSYYIDSTMIQGSTFALNGVTGAREIIHWGLKTELNVPSQVFTTPERYIVAIVTENNNAEYKTLDDNYVKYQCESFARKRKQKESLKAKFPTLTAANFSTFPTLLAGGTVSNTTNESGANPKSAYSTEGKVIGAIQGLAEGKVSEVIEGENGLYVVYVSKNKVAEITEDTNLKTDKDKISKSSEQIGYSIVQELIDDKSEVVDNRRIIQ